MESQFFFNAVAGIAVSLAGFGGVIAWLREDPTRWDPINLWRVKTIIRHALALAFIALSLAPVYSLTEDVDVVVRYGAAAIIAFEVAEMVANRHADPEIWQPRASWYVNMAGGAAFALLQVANLFWASLGVLQIGALMVLGSPAGIFSNFVREMGAPRAPVAPAPSDEPG